MRRLFKSLFIYCMCWPALGQDEPPPNAALPSRNLWEIVRPIEENPPALIQLSRDAIDFILRAPGALAPWKLGPLLSEDTFRLRREHDSPPADSGVESSSPGLDAILGRRLDLLSALIVHSRWNVVRPAEAVDKPEAGTAATLQARMSIPLGEEVPVEARLGIETDAVREDYFVFSTELGSAPNAIEAKWLAWSTRLDYRTSMESPASAKAEQQVGFRLSKRDTIGVSGRIEDRNLDALTSPILDLAPAGDVYWKHEWLAGLESSLKVQQALPDLQSLWLTGAGGDVRLEAAVRASLSNATRLDLQGSTTSDLTQYGLRLQLEFLLGVPAPQPHDRLMLPVGEGIEDRGLRVED